MSTPEEYVRRAEECERLAAACRAPSNREILQNAAAQWRKMAEEAAAGGAAPGSVDVSGVPEDRS
jgi:hypothetical protein